MDTLHAILTGIVNIWLSLVVGAGVICGALQFICIGTIILYIAYKVIMFTTRGLFPRHKDNPTPHP